MWNTLHFLSSLLSATHLFLTLVRQTESQIKTRDLVKKTRQWLLIVHDFAGPFWLNCMDLPEFFTQWWVVCSNVSRWARKHCTNSLNTKNVKTHISEIPSWILLDNNILLICEVEYWTATKQNYVKKKRFEICPSRKTQHKVETIGSKQRLSIKEGRWANHPSL